MAEKSSELENIKAIDTDTAEALTRSETSLETHPDEYQSSALIVPEDETPGEDAADDTEQLREQIEETRRGMSETIDAIQEKLSFQNISEQVKDQVSEQISGAVELAKDVFYGKAGDIVNTVSRGLKEIGKTDLARKAQQNPAALAIIGAGAGALLITFLVNDKKNRKSGKSYNYDYDTSDDQIRYADNSRRELDAVESDRQNESTLGSARAAIGDTANSAYKSISGVAGKTYEGVGSIAAKTYKGMTNAAGFAFDKAGDLGGQVKINYNHYIEENPLAVGAVALALGAAVGYAIPMTQKENEYLGEYRDTVVEKAQATAQDAIGTVKQMATEAQKVITEEVRSATSS